MALTFMTDYAQLPTGTEAGKLLTRVKKAHMDLENGTGQGRGMRGWLRFPAEYPKTEEYRRIKAAAKTIMENAEVLLVIGIGGSYLGARAVIEAVASRYYNETRKGTPAIYFTGNTLSESDFADLDQIIEGKDFYINVISKSGKTLETAAAFRHYRMKLEEKWGGNKEEVNRRIYATTGPTETEEPKKVSLTRLEADAKGWETFEVPRDMGGRYSVLSAVGLLPIACAGIGVDKLLEGAADAQAAYAAPGETLEDNDCDYYAAMRYFYYRHRHKALEIFATYEPSMTQFGEWFKQLYAESEGKRGRGLFPTSVTFTTDLHSLGQYIQQGRRIMFETVLTFQKARNQIAVKADKDDYDFLNYLPDGEDSTFHHINRQAFKGTAQAHLNGNCPSLVLELEKRDAYNIGWLIYFFERACATSGYMIGINPFDQDGVESYKKCTSTLLNTPAMNLARLRALMRDVYHIGM